MPLRQLTLSHEPASASEARRAVAAAFRSLPLSEPMVDTATLLTSELVTNAVLHGRGALLVTALADRTRVRVEVADGSPVLPKARRARPDGTTGRGLLLLATLAARWGSERLAAPDLRKLVWFELDRTSDTAPHMGSEARHGLDGETVEPL